MILPGAALIQQQNTLGLQGNVPPSTMDIYAISSTELAKGEYPYHPCSVERHLAVLWDDLWD